VTTNHVMKKFVRRLRRNLFLSVPNNGEQEIDLSELRSAQNATLEIPAFPTQFDMQFDMQLDVQLDAQPVEQTLITSNRFAPEPWDANHRDR
jgi:hypothetical protein